MLRLRAGVLVTVACASVGFTAQAANLDKEYDQVRSIALRDPKVKAAFEKAAQKLDDKIVEIDPALKGYVRGRTSNSTSAPSAESATTRKPFVRPSKPPAAPSAAASATHVIATGDTLSSIAARYKVSIGDLKAANPSVDEKKLQVGQKLTIPSHRPHSG